MKQQDADRAAATGTEWQAQIDAAVDAHFEKMVEVRRHLHAHPEPSGEEHATTAFLRDQARASGFQIQPGPDELGLILEPGEADDGKKIALRADIDALRLQDAKQVPYHSTGPGIMHACGHDGHAATVLGAVWALDQAAREGHLPWPVNWRAIFQPAEETNRGAIDMMRVGALENVGGIFGVHMDPSRTVGTVAIGPGAITADCVETEIKIHGRGAHAARPHESRDPIAAAAQLISSVYMSVPRLTDAHDPVVVSFGHIHGGDAPNVIPNLVLLRGTIRSFSESTRRRTMEHVRQLARGIAEASGTRIEVAYLEGPPAVYNDPGLTKLMRDCAVDVLGENSVENVKNPSMGGEDFANYLGQVPGSLFRLGCASSADAPPLHSPDFDLDERALSVGAKILARAAVEWSRPEGQAPGRL